MFKIDIHPSIFILENRAIQGKKSLLAILRQLTVTLFFFLPLFLAEKYNCTHANKGKKMAKVIVAVTPPSSSVAAAATIETKRGEKRKRETKEKKEEEEEHEVGLEKEQKKKRWVAQRRTSMHKKNVYLTRRYVYKGPYERDSSRLQTTLARHLVLACIFNDKTVQTPSLVRWSDGWYLRFPNVAATPASQWKTQETTTMKGREAITLVLRESMGIQQVSGCMKQLSTHQKEQILYHLLLRLCISPSIGDSHLGNMLYNGKAVYGVDLEDMRKHTDIPQVKTVLEFVSLLCTKKQHATLLQPLATTLLQRKRELISSLQKAACVTSDRAIQWIKQRFPEASINMTFTQERLQRCISLLSSLTS